MRGPTALVALGLAALALLSDCDSFSLPDQFNRSATGKPLALALSSTGNLVPGDTIVLEPSGGTPPYTFDTSRGNTYYIGGTASSISGNFFTAGDSIGTEHIFLEDSDFRSVTAMVTVVPPAPTGFAADGSYGGNNDVELTWVASTHPAVNKFRIERISPTGFSLVELDSGKTSYVDSTASPSQLNTYRIYALAGPYQSAYVESSALGKGD